MTVPNVILSWHRSVPAKSDNIRTDGRNLWSYQLLIGYTTTEQTLSGKEVTYKHLTDYRAPYRISQTTSTHVGRASAIRDPDTGRWYSAITHDPTPAQMRVAKLPVPDAPSQQPTVKEPNMNADLPHPFVLMAQINFPDPDHADYVDIEDIAVNVLYIDRSRHHMIIKSCLGTWAGLIIKLFRERVDYFMVSPDLLNNPHTTLDSKWTPVGAGSAITLGIDLRDKGVDFQSTHHNYGMRSAHYRNED